MSLYGLYMPLSMTKLCLKKNSWNLSTVFHNLSLPTLLLFTQVTLKLLSLKITTGLFLKICMITY